MLEVAAWLVVLAPTLTTADFAGLYETHQMEVGGALELKPDGRFRYQLDYGAVSESAAGTWALDAKTVRLTSDPMPRESDFTLIEDKPAPVCEISVSVDWGKVDWSTDPRVLVTYEGDPKIYFVYTGEHGKLESPRCKATSVRPLVPVYGGVGTEVKLTPGQGHKLSFRFEPNDIGQAAFHAEPLTLDGQSLVLTRYDASIRFIRVRP
jgi:hypothetical protein